MDESALNALRNNFEAGGMREVKTRVALLKKLKAEIGRRENDVMAAVRADFNKPPFDTYATEIAVVYGEIDTAVKRLRRWARPRRARTGLANFPAKGRIYAEGYGVALIIAPWNYPFQLSLAPLVGAIAAGNCAVVKPASATADTARVIAEIIGAVFAQNEVVCVVGPRGRDLLEMKFDVIFFTGGARTGRAVMAAAAKHLTPVVLELGGKSPCIVDAGCDVPTAARRLAWAKFLNGGQTCVAPDYLYLHADVYDAFLEAFIAEIRAMYYQNGALREDFPFVVTEEKAGLVRDMLDRCRILFGGKVAGRSVEPTVVEGNDCPFMEEEIFAPVLPVIRYEDTGEIAAAIKARPRPLALYYFGKNPRPFVEGVSFGGGCVGDGVMHVAEHRMPFGGVGESGMGMYHGKYSFDAFTHYKSVLYKGKAELKLKYPPHGGKDLKTIRRLLK